MNGRDLIDVEIINTVIVQKSKGGEMRLYFFVESFYKVLMLNIK